MDSKSSSPPKKTLRQSLRDLLRLRISRLRSTPLGSGILRRAEPVAPYTLPQFSTVSVFPDFGASDWDVAHYSSANTAQYHLPEPSLIQRHDSKKSLLPATSLSQFDLHQTFVKRGQVHPHRVVYETVGDGLLSGSSRQASVASLAPAAVRRTVSTLRIRESSRNLTTTPVLGTNDPSLAAPTRRTDRPRATVSSRNLRSMKTSAFGRSSASTTSSKRHSKLPFTLVDHFRSFVVLDTSQPGYPVSATSDNLKFVFQAGEKFLLNNVQIEGTTMDIVLGTDAAGDPVTHLVLFSPLVAPSSGRSRFMLACLVDVTPFIEETATLPEQDLDTISEEGSISSIGEGVATPPMQASPEWSQVRYGLSCEDLLGGCCLDEGPSRKGVESDIWLDIASSERSNKKRRRHFSQSSSRPSSTSSISTASSMVDEALESFVSGLQTLYQDFFLLGKSALDDDSYEICNVSATLQETKDFVSGHLSRTPSDIMQEMSVCLTQDAPFTLRVNWGSHGEPKQLYCAPLYGKRSLTWICFLVDDAMPSLW